MTVAALVRDLTAFSIQIALIVLAVAVLVKVAHLPARVRYHGLRLVLVAALLVPWLLRSPEIAHDRARDPAQRSLTMQTPAEAVPGELDPIESFVAPEPRLPIPWGTVLVGILAAGVVGRGLWLAVGLIRLRQLTRTGTVVEEPEYARLQEQIGARATITEVAGLAQPATFGVRRPVVMLPDALSEAPAPLRRAVVIHELFHVRRRDWLFVLAEEVVRTAFWFHPAIFWLTSQIQLAREEIVDELTVRATGDRRGYMRALLVFADSGGLSPLDGARGRPALAFARRRQLFHRILSVSKEKVMSRPRIVLATIVLAAVVATASWSAHSLFPIVKASSVTLLRPTSLIGVQNASLAAPVSMLAEDPGRMSASAQRRAVQFEQQTGAGVVAPRQVTPENPIPRRTRGGDPAWPSSFAGRQFHVLVQTLVTLDRGGAVIAVDRGGCQIFERPAVGEPNDDVCSAFFDASAGAIRLWRYERPAQAPLQFTVLSTFVPGSEARISQVGSELQRYLREAPDNLLNRGVLANIRAESLRSQLFELTDRYREVERAYRIVAEPYRAGHPVFDRLQLDLALLNGAMSMLQKLGTSSLETQEQLLRAQDEMKYAQDALRVIERRLVEYSSQLEANVTGDVKATPASPLDGSPLLQSPSGRASLQVEGAVSAPRVIKNPKPLYTAELMRARIEGTVVIDALVDEQGRVADARVIRSIPQLDEAALTAAKQWEFTPGLRNGEPVPVLVRIELEFNLRK